MASHGNSTLWQQSKQMSGLVAIICEMQSDRYDFFLDEMIKHKNCLIIKELK